MLQKLGNEYHTPCLLVYKTNKMIEAKNLQKVNKI